MRRLLIMLMIVTGAAAPAAQGWSAPQPLPVSSAVFGDTLQADVAADGTTASGDTAFLHKNGIGGNGYFYSFYAAVGARPLTELVDDQQGADGAVAALPGGGALAATTRGYYEDATTDVRVAGADGVFGPPQHLGPGRLVALQTDYAGDAVVVLSAADVRTPEAITTSEAFAPAGGSFGAPVVMPLGGPPESVVLGDDGTATVFASPTGDPRFIQVASRYRDDTPGPSIMLAAASRPFPERAVYPVAAADAHGRVPAAWAQDAQLFTARRDADGNWTTAATTMPSAPLGVAVASDPAGDAILGWRDTDVRVQTGSLGDPALGPPTTLDRGAAVGPVLAESADGSAVVADRAATLHAMTRSGTGAFGRPVVAGCPAALQGAWVTDAGEAILRADNALIHEASGPATPCAPTPTVRVHGRRVRIAGAGPEPLRLTWRAHGQVLARRTVTAPARVRAPTAHATLVLRRLGVVVALRRA